MSSSPCPFAFPASPCHTSVARGPWTACAGSWFIWNSVCPGPPPAEPPLLETLLGVSLRFPVKLETLVSPV